MASAIHQSLLVSIQGKEDFGITNGSFTPAVVKNSPLRMIGRTHDTLAEIVTTTLIQGCLLELLAGSKKGGDLFPLILLIFLINKRSNYDYKKWCKNDC